MDSNNKSDKLSGLFSDENINVPVEFNWEHMEDGIMDKMEKNKTEKRPIFLFVFFLIIMALLVFIKPFGDTKQNNFIKETLRYQKPNNEISKTHVEHSSDSLITLPSYGKTIFDNLLDQEQKQHQRQNIILNTDAEQKPEVDVSKPMTIINKKGNNLNQFSIAKAKTGRTSKKVKTSDKTSEVSTSLGEEIYKSPLTFSTNQNQEKTLSTIIEPSVSSPNILEALLSYLPNINIDHIQSNKDELDIFVLNPIIKKQQTTMLPTDYITVSGGISDWNMNYGSFLPERHQYEQTLLSYHSQMSYTHKFKNNFTLMTGIRYQQLETRLDWNTLLENYTTVTLKDTIIAYSTNSLTGKQSSIRGDVEVSVNATRQVRHFNQYQIIQIPLAVGKSWKITDKWHTELSLGGALNIYTYNKGRNIYQGGLVDLSDTVTPFIDNRLGFHAMGIIKLHYRINQNYGLVLDASLQKSLTNWSTEANVQMMPQIRNLGLGVFYSL